MNTLNIEIGQRIQNLRKCHKMTQEQLAEALDISIKHCSCVERGKSALSIEKLMDVCTILDTSLDYLVKGEDAALSDAIPLSFQEYVKSASPSERKLIYDYLLLYLKLRNE